MTPDAFAAVLAELHAEHGRAVAVHGFDDDHDDRHSDADWSWRLLRRVTEVMAPETVMRTTPEERRRALFECAHIAASAVAAHDRRAAGRLAALDDAAARTAYTRHLADPDSLDSVLSSTDASWRYVTRPEIEGIERHTLTCDAWSGGCRGECVATLNPEEPPT